MNHEQEEQEPRMMNHMTAVVTMDDEVWNYETMDTNKNNDDITLKLFMNEEITMTLGTSYRNIEQEQAVQLEREEEQAIETMNRSTNTDTNTDTNTNTTRNKVTNKNKNKQEQEQKQTRRNRNSGKQNIKGDY